MVESQDASPGQDPVHGDGEFDLMRYWRVLMQRRFVVAGCIGLSVTLVMILTFFTPPLYTATSTLEIERKGPDILMSKDILNVDPSYAGYQNFYQTQYRILASRAVLRRAADEIDLIHRPEFADQRGSPVSRLLSWAGSLTGSDADAAGSAEDPHDAAITFISDRLGVLPIRGSHLVRIAITDGSPTFAAELAHAMTEAYQQYHYDARYSTTGKAKGFLAKDVLRLREELKKLEHQLQEYGVLEDIVGISNGSLDISEQALSDINTRLTDSMTRLATADARHRSVADAPPEALAEVMNSALMTHLKQRIAELERDYSQMSERFNADWPPRIRLEQELDKSRQQLRLESQEIARQVQAVTAADLRQAKTEVESIKSQRELQSREVQRVNEATIEYSSLKGEVDAKREALAQLVARKNETETAHNLKDSSTSNIRVVDEAAVPKYPVSPRKLFNLLAALIMGGGLGVAMAFLVDHLDNTVKNEEDLARAGNLAILGHVPATQSLQLVDRGPTPAGELTAQLDLACHTDARSKFSETFRNLRTSLLLAAPDHPPRHIVVTSCEPSDGKSTVALNLAIVLTQLGRRVLLVDADLRRPRLHKSLSLPNAKGLSSFLSGNAPLDDLVRETTVPNLFSITSGPIPPNPSELLGSPLLQSLLAEFQQANRFEHVIFDSPPLLSVTDATILSAKMDSTILVVRAGQTRREALSQSASMLRKSRVSVIGTVLNAVSSDSGFYYGGYKSGSGYDAYYGADPDEDDQAKESQTDDDSRHHRRAG